MNIVNTIRPFTVVRKNWLYSQTAKGPHASAILYSIVQTAMCNCLDPYLYLEHLFKELPARPQRADINDLLLWNVTLAALTTGADLSSFKIKKR